VATLGACRLDALITHPLLLVSAATERPLRVKRLGVRRVTGSPRSFSDLTATWEHVGTANDDDGQ
jgi:hypothetical protein